MKISKSRPIDETPSHEVVTNGNRVLTSVNRGGKNRIEFIDLAKGVCILLVVFIHCCSSGTESSMDVSLKSLRMPLYFVLSGLFFSTYGSLYNLVVRKINKMIIPFVFFMVISYMVSYCIDMISGNQITYHITHNLTLSRTWWNSPFWPNIALWFLICLFWDNMLFCIISFISSKKIIQGLLCMGLALVGVLLQHIGKRLPIYVDSAFLSLPFFYFGYLLRKSGILIGSASRKELIIATCALLIMIIIPIYSMSYIDFRSANLSGNIVVAFGLPLFSVVGVLLLCKAIVRLPIISYFGRYSIVILGIHWPIILIASNFSNVLATDWKYLFYIVLMASMYPLIKFFIKVFPYFTAQKDLITLTPSIQRKRNVA